MNRTKKVLQPLRFVNAYYDFSPVQKDFIMLVQHMTSKQKEIKSDFTIDLRPYFESNGIKPEDVRQNHYKELTNDLLESKVTFKYTKGDRLYSMYNLFSRCTINEDFSLEVSIIDDVLPLFYINKLEEGHFKENRLVRELFEQSFPDYDKYIAYSPKTYVEFRESQTKKLFEKLLQYKRLKKHTFEFSKDELYLLLGYGYLRDKSKDPQQQIFQIVGQEFIQTSYKGVEGWKSLRKKLNKWLGDISNHPKSGITVIPNKNNQFSTKGKPIRSIFVQVEYDEEFAPLTPAQEKGISFLEPYKLSRKQKFKIVSDFSYEQIVKRVQGMVVSKSDHNGNRYYGEYQRADHRKIDNVPGFIYGVVFEYGRR